MLSLFRTKQLESIAQETIVYFVLTCGRFLFLQSEDLIQSLFELHIISHTNKNKAKFRNSIEDCSHNLARTANSVIFFGDEKVHEQTKTKNYY